MNLLAATGLFLDIVGVCLLFRSAPEKFPDPQWSAFFAVEGEARKRREEWEAMKPVRAQRARVGIVLILIGFGLQLLGEFVVLP